MFFRERPEETKDIVLLTGVATDTRVWKPTFVSLSRLGWKVRVPERPRSGIIDREAEAIKDLCKGAIVIGVSGGATLALELASREPEISAVIAHEPAAGSLAPHLLDDAVHALNRDGVAEFARTLYGPSWTPDMNTSTESCVRGELSMFRSFEPKEPILKADRVILTVGSRSPRNRYSSVKSVADKLQIDWCVLPKTSHAAHIDGAFSSLSSVPDSDRGWNLNIF